jgi:hypothetical protein
MSQHLNGQTDERLRPSFAERMEAEGVRFPPNQRSKDVWKRWAATGQRRRHPKPSTPLETRIANLQELLAMIGPVPEEWLKPDPPKNDYALVITKILADVLPERPKEMWRKRLYFGKLNVIHGDPGMGKTWVILYVISCLTTGKPFCDGAPCEECEVLFVTAEDGIADTIRPRLDKLQADPSRVHVLELVRMQGREVALDLDKHLIGLRSWLNQHPNVRVVVLDPLAAFLGKTDSHRNSEVRSLLGRLAKLAEDTGVGILAIDHLAKGAGKALHRGIGSIAFTAAPRAVWQVLADPDEPDRRLFLPVKTNLARISGLAFKVTDDGVVWEPKAVTMSADEASAEAGETPRGEARAWLKDALKKGPVAAHEIEERAKKDGICMRTLKAAKKELGIASERRDGAWSWLPPKSKRS